MVVKIECGGKQHEVQLDAPLKLRCNFNCKAIEYHLKLEAPVASSSNNNAVDVLLSSQKIILPNKVTLDKLRADQRLYNDLIDMLGLWNVGWSPDSVKTVGERCVNL